MLNKKKERRNFFACLTQPLTRSALRLMFCAVFCMFWFLLFHYLCSFNVHVSIWKENSWKYDTSLWSFECLIARTTWMLCFALQQSKKRRKRVFGLKQKRGTPEKRQRWWQTTLVRVRAPERPHASSCVVLYHTTYVQSAKAARTLLLVHRNFKSRSKWN